MAQKGRSKTLLGGAVILAIGVLIGMFGKLPGFGTGSGNSRSVATSQPVEVPLAAKDRIDEPGTQQVVTVLIDDRSYALVLQVGSETVYRPVDLPDLVREASAATGNSDGLRVRILRRESARASTEENLYAALADAGITGDAVYAQRDFTR